VNPERTRQQYSTHNEQPKWNGKTQHENSRSSSEQSKPENVNHNPDKENSSSDINSTKQNKQQSKRNKNDTKPNRTKGKKSKFPSKPPQASTENLRSGGNTPDPGSLNDNVLYKILRIIKQIVIIFACFMLMILLFGLKFGWQILRTVLKYTLLLILWVVCK